MRVARLAPTAPSLGIRTAEEEMSAATQSRLVSSPNHIFPAPEIWLPITPHIDAIKDDVARIARSCDAPENWDPYAKPTISWENVITMTTTGTDKKAVIRMARGTRDCPRFGSETFREDRAGTSGIPIAEGMRPITAARLAATARFPRSENPDSTASHEFMTYKAARTLRPARSVGSP